MKTKKIPFNFAAFNLAKQAGFTVKEIATHNSVSYKTLQAKIARLHVTEIKTYQPRQEVEASRDTMLHLLDEIFVEPGNESEAKGN